MSESQVLGPDEKGGDVLESFPSSPTEFFDTPSSASSSSFYTFPPQHAAQMSKITDPEDPRGKEEVDESDSPQQQSQETNETFSGVSKSVTMEITLGGSDNEDSPQTGTCVPTVDRKKEENKSDELTIFDWLGNEYHHPVMGPNLIQQMKDVGVEAITQFNFQNCSAVEIANICMDNWSVLNPQELVDDVLRQFIYPRFSIKASKFPNCGRGLFLEKASGEGDPGVIDAGTVLFPFVGTIARSDDVVVGADLDKALGLVGDFLVHPVPQGNMASFLNHSHDPNCDNMLWHRDGYIGAVTFLYAARDIKPGSELTMDYRLSISADEIKSGKLSPCYCHSLLCPRYLEDREEGFPADVDTVRKSSGYASFSSFLDVPSTTRFLDIERSPDWLEPYLATSAKYYNKYAVSCEIREAKWRSGQERRPKDMSHFAKEALFEVGDSVYVDTTLLDESPEYTNLKV